MENQINTYSSQEVPYEVKKWNWGAFMLNMVWGIGNKTYLPLLCLIPIFNIVWVFICGFKGNEWAWKKGNYKNPEEFLLVQATWNRAGFVSFIIAIILIVLEFLFFTLIASIIYTQFRHTSFNRSF